MPANRFNRIGEKWFGLWRRNAGLRMFVEFTGAAIVLTGAFAFGFDLLNRQEDRAVRNAQLLAQIADISANDPENARGGITPIIEFLAQQGVSMSDITITNSNLIEAHLGGANLSRANLRGTDLSWAILTEADLYRTDLRGAILRETSFIGAYLTHAEFQGADLRGARLDRATLIGADLSRAYLRSAELQGADLRGANLFGAYLENANLDEADLKGTNFTKANLTKTLLNGAELNGAILDSIRGVDTLSVAFQCDDNLVIDLPSNITPPRIVKCGAVEDPTEE